MKTTLECLRHNEREARKAGWFDIANGCRENADSLEKYGEFWGYIWYNRTICKYTIETGYTYYKLM